VPSARETYSGEALAILASHDIEEGAVLVTIPKAAVLSCKNTSLAPFLEEHRIGGGLGLVLACMHEVALGPQSPWYALTHPCFVIADPKILLHSPAPHELLSVILVLPSSPLDCNG